MTRNTRLGMAAVVLLVAARCANVEWGNTPPATPAPQASASATRMVQAAPDPDVDKALEALKANDFTGAKSLLDKALQKNPKSVAALYYMAVSLENLNDKKGAEAKYKEALQVKPDAFEPAISLSALYVLDKRWDEAIAVAQKALATQPQDVELHLNLAEAFGGKGDKKSAIIHYEQAVKNAPNDAAVRCRYADFLVETDDKENAIKEAKAVLAAAGDNRKLIARAGRLLGLAGAQNDCIAAFDRAISIADDPDARVRRGLCRLNLKDDKGARVDFEAALSQSPNYAPAHYYLAESLLATDAEKALKEYDAVVATEPNGPLAESSRKQADVIRKQVEARKKKKGKK